MAARNRSRPLDDGSASTDECHSVNNKKHIAVSPLYLPSHICTVDGADNLGARTSNDHDSAEISFTKRGWRIGSSSISFFHSVKAIHVIRLERTQPKKYFQYKQSWLTNFELGAHGLNSAQSARTPAHPQPTIDLWAKRHFCMNESRSHHSPRDGRADV